MRPFIVGIGGPGSGSGKTSFACRLLGALKQGGGWGAIKYSASPIYSSITDDAGTLWQEGKDTARLLEAGAEEVLWVQSTEEDREETLELAVGRLSHLRGIVVEGNGAIEVLRPDIVIFIAVNRPQVAKDNAGKVLGNSHVAVFDDEIPPEAPEKTVKFSGDEIDKCISYVIGAINEKER
jgi:molybdopterin-guanine dinucleotide biosynthesis protein